MRPTRAAARRPARHREFRDACRSYLVLLPVGFSLPPPLPAARCALTAPFHPCRPPRRTGERPAVYFLWHFPWGRPRRGLPGTAPPWSPDFPLPVQRRRAAIRPSGAHKFAPPPTFCQSPYRGFYNRPQRTPIPEKRGTAMPATLGADGYRYEVRDN